MNYFLNKELLKEKEKRIIITISSYENIENKFKEMKNRFFLLINDFPKLDNSGSGGSINQSDIYTIIKIIIKNFKEINEFFERLKEGQGLLIVTNTIGSWDKNDGMGVFYQ